MEECRSHWLLKPEVAYLNHIHLVLSQNHLDKQLEYRNMLEEEPVQSMVCELLIYCGEHKVLGEFVCISRGHRTGSNATEGITVVQSIEFQPGDQILYLINIWKETQLRMLPNVRVQSVEVFLCPSLLQMQMML